jgi:hypothetical protein
MPRLICRFLYVEYHMLASYCEFAIIPVYMPISVPVSACSVTDLTCQLQYTCIYMPAHECQISIVRCQVSLYANLGCYMTNCYLSVYMPSALFQELYVESLCYMSNLICQLQYVYTYMPAHECLIFSMSCQASFYVKLLYLSLYAKCFVSRVMYRMIWAICQTPYARLQYAKCYDHRYVF